jgi:hypothetical protein
MEVSVDIREAAKIIVVQVNEVGTIAVATPIIAVKMSTREAEAIKSRTLINETRDQITRTTIAETMVEATIKAVIKTTVASIKGEGTIPIKTITTSPISTRTTTEEEGDTNRVTLLKAKTSSSKTRVDSRPTTNRTHLSTLMG